MGTILDQIVADKRQELTQAKARLSETALEEQLLVAQPAPPRGFHAALLATPHVRVIAEVKRRSPSAGAIHTEADAVKIAQMYVQGGAACISVLTDELHFGGSLDDLRAVRSVVAVPVLRKDFILERYQVLEARLNGADAVLLIAEILADPTLKFLLNEIQQLGMDALVECYDAENLPRIVDAGAKLIGINNRDLHSFTVRLEHSLELASQVPADCTLVSESGIKNRADVERLAQVGVKAVLVGETLMRSQNVTAMLGELTSVPCPRNAIRGLVTHPDCALPARAVR